MANSIVEYFAEHENYKCGYCKKTDTNFAHGMWAHTMSVEDYQALIDRGWRRSGKYCYKPTLNIICCPMYTIRCRALEFKATKSQKKVLKRFNKYLMGEEEVLGKSNRKLSESSDDMKLDYCGGGDEFVESKQKPQELNIYLRDGTENLNESSSSGDVGPSSSHDLSLTTESINKGPMCASSSKELSASTTKEIKKGSGPDPTKMPCRKAKDIRKERKLEKLKAQGKDITILESKANTNEKDFELFIKELPAETKHRLESADLKYYYMGYYIHSCPKMRYKGRFSPSDLLCPETYKWFPLNDCLPKLEASPYSRLNPDLDALDDNYPNSRDINHIQVLYKGSVWLFGAYKRKHLRNIEKIAAVMEYASLVGARAATSIVLIGSTKRFI
ncbi:unnamed protein product, partial [Leptidea sinapis]